MPQFSQFQIEDAIYKLLPHGAEVEIARAIGKSPGLISQYANPHDSRESPIYKAAQMLAALARIDPQAGREALDLFIYFVRLSMPHDNALPVDVTRPIAYKESIEFCLAEAEGKPVSVRIKELHDRVHADTELLKSLYEEQKREHVLIRATARLTGVNGRKRA